MVVIEDLSTFIKSVLYWKCLGGGTVRHKGLKILPKFGIIVSKSKVWYHSEPDNIKAHTSIYDLEVHR